MPEQQCCAAKGWLTHLLMLGQGWRLIVTGHSLGAGAAALLTLALKDRFPSAPSLSLHISAATSGRAEAAAGNSGFSGCAAQKAVGSSAANDATCCCQAVHAGKQAPCAPAGPAPGAALAAEHALTWHGSALGLCWQGDDRLECAYKCTATCAAVLSYLSRPTAGAEKPP